LGTTLKLTISRNICGREDGVVTASPSVLISTDFRQRPRCTAGHDRGVIRDKCLPHTPHCLRTVTTDHAGDSIGEARITVYVAAHLPTSPGKKNRGTNGAGAGAFAWLSRCQPSSV
jgi:hypothetical protein